MVRFMCIFVSTCFVDDAAAIFAAFGCSDIEVIGLTTIYGNVDVETATQNALRLLQLLDMTSVLNLLLLINTN